MWATYTTPKKRNVNHCMICTKQGGPSRRNILRLRTVHDLFVVVDKQPELDPDRIVPGLRIKNRFSGSIPVWFWI